MVRLSVVMIVKNEAAGIAACLQQFAWADEIVVLDGGSTDETVEIARKFTDNVFVESDWQGFGVQRQRAQAKATGDWLLMVDADERPSAELVDEIRAVVAENNQGHVYALPRLSYCFGRFIRYSGWYPDHVVRLYPREKAGYNDARVHEKLIYPEQLECVKLKSDLLHYTYKDLEHYLVKSAHYAAEWALQRQQRGKQASLFQGVLHGVGCFVRMYILRAGFLDGQQGLLLALLSAHSTFAKYADLWVRAQPSRLYK